LRRRQVPMSCALYISISTRPRSRSDARPAQAVVDLLGQQGSKAGKYGVTITGSKGVQVGDHNTQTNTF
jgi:hypothetical protein